LFLWFGAMSTGSGRGLVLRPRVRSVTD